MFLQPSREECMKGWRSVGIDPHILNPGNTTTGGWVCLSAGLNALVEGKMSVPAGNWTTIDILLSSSHPGRYSNYAIVATYNNKNHGGKWKCNSVRHYRPIQASLPSAYVVKTKEELEKNAQNVRRKKSRCLFAKQTHIQLRILWSLGSCDRASWAKYEDREKPTRCNN